MKRIQEASKDITKFLRELLSAEWVSWQEYGAPKGLPSRRNVGSIAIHYPANHNEDELPTTETIQKICDKFNEMWGTVYMPIDQDDMPNYITHSGVPSIGFHLPLGYSPHVEVEFQIDTLEELAKLIEERAVTPSHTIEAGRTRLIRERSRGQVEALELAACIIRKTTLKGNKK